jgi:hypothetical protein
MLLAATTKRECRVVADQNKSVLLALLLLSSSFALCFPHGGDGRTAAGRCNKDPAHNLAIRNGFICAKIKRISHSR